MNQPSSPLWEIARLQALAIYQPVYVGLTGDLISGIILSRVIYWFTPKPTGETRLRVMRDGKLWLAKSRESWKVEYGISIRQYARAMAHLQKLKFITTEVHLFNNRRVVYIMLHEDRVFKAYSKSTKGAFGKVPNVSLEKDETASSYNKTTTGKTTGDTPVPTSKEVQEKFKGKKQMTIVSALSLAGENLTGFCSAWVILVPYFHDLGYMMPPLTGKQRGMLSQFRKRVGVARAPEVMVWAVQNWTGGFTKKVLEMHQHALPYTPHPGYLLKYVDSALSGWQGGLSHQAVASVQPIATKPVMKKYVVK